MKRLMTVGAMAAFGAVFAANPEVSDVSFREDNLRNITINYTLASTDAVITIDVLTNGVSIGHENIQHLVGDVNKKVSPGAKQIVWPAWKSWPNHTVTNAKIEVKAWALHATPPYMAVNLVSSDAENVVRYYASAYAVPGGVSNAIYKTDVMLMRRIPAAGSEWPMGSLVGDSGRDNARETNQIVRLTKDYYIGVYEVTQRQWENVASSFRPWPSFFKDDVANRDMRPVEQVSYFDIRESTSNAANTQYQYHEDPHPSSFLGVLRKRTGVDFDLPSESQWEYACRAGNWANKFGNGTDYSDANMKLVGRYSGSPGTVSSKYAATDSPTNGTAIVGSYQPNNWGLYDMHGNVWEWCLDWCEYQHLYDGGNAEQVNTTPVNLSDNSNAPARVVRGGSWNGGATYCRSAFRHRYKPSNRGNNCGFRLVVPAGGQQSAQ